MESVRMDKIAREKTCICSCSFLEGQGDDYIDFMDGDHELWQHTQSS